MKKIFLLSNLLIFCFILLSVAAKARPVFTLNPVSDTVCYSADSAHFTVAATDSFTVKYLWQVSTDGGVTWSLASASPYRGDSSATLTVTLSTTLSGDKYRAIATDSLGLKDTSSVAVLIVVGNPVAGTITGASSLCVGSVTTFTDGATGGIWSSIHSSVATVGPTGIVTALSAGKDTIEYTNTNICGTASAYDSIKVDTLPAAGMITGNDTVCKGSTLTLTDTTSGGVWSATAPSVGTVSPSGIVTSISQGFDTIKYTFTNSFGCMGVAAKVIRVDTNAVAMAITGPTVTCIGHSITLYDPNIYGSQMWTASNGNATVASSGDVTGVSGGTDIISLAFTNACNTVDTSISVEIDAPISHGTLSGASAVCAGAWIHLTASVPGGFWLTDSSAIATVDGSGNVTGIAQGSTTISYLFENGCGVSAATQVVSVYSVARPITAGSDSVGIGDMRILADSVTGGVWTSGDVSIATVTATTGIVTGVAPGIAAITYTVMNVCGTSYAIFDVNVGMAPLTGDINAGDDSVCIGNTLSLSSSVPGGTWTSAPDSVATVSPSGLLTAVAKGMVTVTYTVTNAFGTSSTTQDIYVNTTPVVHISGPSILALYSNYFPIATPEGGVWSSDNAGVFISIAATNITADTTINGHVYFGATYCSIVPIAAGIDTLHYKIHNTCGVTDSIFIINIPAAANGVSIINGKSSALAVYPNPNTGDFTLDLPAATTEDASVIITDLVGREVKQMVISTNNTVNIKLDVPSGIYFLSATTATNKYEAKITVTK
jgi:uncharacterized protein YjdB